MQPGAGQIVDPSEYNAIDAGPAQSLQACAAYLAPALERNIQDPERRGYLGQLAGKEAQSASEVSPNWRWPAVSSSPAAPGAIRYPLAKCATLILIAYTVAATRPHRRQCANSRRPNWGANSTFARWRWRTSKRRRGTAANMLTGAG